MREHDPLANKTVLYLAADAAVTLSYMGDAYLDGVPTDEWIARCLRGDAMPPSKEPDHVIRISRPIPPWPSIDAALHRLATGLEGASRRLPAKRSRAHLGIVFAGARWDVEGYASTFCGALVSEQTGHGFTVLWGRAPKAPGETASMYAPPYLTRAENDELQKAMRDRDLATLEPTYVDVVRTVSGRFAGVGPHCMCVRFSLLPDPPTITCTFRAHRTSGKSPPLGGGEPYLSYSPWLILPGESQAPAESGGRGNWESQLGPSSWCWWGPRNFYRNGAIGRLSTSSHSGGGLLHQVTDRCGVIAIHVTAAAYEERIDQRRQPARIPRLDRRTPAGSPRRGASSPYRVRRAGRHRIRVERREQARRGRQRSRPGPATPG
jgi:hypothetical protein